MTDAPLYENVPNDLDIQLFSEHRRADADVRADVVQALMLDAVVPTTIRASVKDGFVTLTGTADRESQRRQAAFVAGTIMGVTGVENEVDLVGPVPRSQDIEQSIREVLGRDARVDADDIVVATSPGTVTLSGTVRSWSERHAVVAAAWAAPGVRTVHDHLTVSQ